MGIIAGVGTVAAEGGKRTSLSQDIEMAQTKAVRNALDEGVKISDTEELLRRKDLARQAVLAENNNGS
jgi:hypothetical protein